MRASDVLEARRVCRSPSPAAPMLEDPFVGEERQVAFKPTLPRQAVNDNGTTAGCESLLAQPSSCPRDAD